MKHNKKWISFEQADPIKDIEEMKKLIEESPVLPDPVIFTETQYKYWRGVFRKLFSWFKQ